MTLFCNSVTLFCNLLALSVTLFCNSHCRYQETFEHIKSINEQQKTPSKKPVFLFAPSTLGR